MKKLTAMLLVAAMTIGLVACGNNAGTPDSGNAPAQDAGTETSGGGLKLLQLRSPRLKSLPLPVQTM